MQKSTVAILLASLASLYAGTASARGLVPCAREGGFCRLPYPTTVVYGVPGKSTSLEIGEAASPAVMTCLAILPPASSSNARSLIAASVATVGEIGTRQITAY